MSSVDQKLKALEFFKDWSNYLLVTTTAALGWVSSSQALNLKRNLITFSVWCFAVSIVFGIFTLALIPIVGEELNVTHQSFYDVEAPFRIFWLWGPTQHWQLKAVCWPQHVLFIAGIILYALAYKPK